MDTVTQPVTLDSALSNLSRRTKRLTMWLILLALLLVASIATLSFLFLRQIKAMEEAQKEVAFSNFGGVDRRDVIRLTKLQNSRQLLPSTPLPRLTFELCNHSTVS